MWVGSTNAGCSMASLRESVKYCGEPALSVDLGVAATARRNGGRAILSGYTPSDISICTLTVLGGALRA